MVSYLPQNRHLKIYKSKIKEYNGRDIAMPIQPTELFRSLPLEIFEFLNFLVFLNFIFVQTFKNTVMAQRPNANGKIAVRTSNGVR